MEVQNAEDWLQQLQLDRKLPNRAQPVKVSDLEALRQPVISAAKAKMQQRQQAYTEQTSEELAEQLRVLEALQQRQLAQVERQLEKSGQAEHFKAARREERIGRIERVFDEYQTWVRDTLTIEPVPFIQIIAVFTTE